MLLGEPGREKFSYTLIRWFITLEFASLDCLVSSGVISNRCTPLITSDNLFEMQDLKLVFVSEILSLVRSRVTLSEKFKQVLFHGADSLSIRYVSLIIVG